MASRAFAADEVPRDFDAEEAMRAELEALGEDVCSSEEERFAEDGAGDKNARGPAGDPARSPPVGRAWGWDRDPVEDVQRAWSRREARLRRNSASRGRLGDDDDEFSPGAPRDDARASSASASSGDETSSEGETRETRAAFLRAYEAQERARAQERDSRRAAARRDAEAAEKGAEAERAEAARAEAETAQDVFERRPEGLPISAGTDVSDAAEPGRAPERTRAFCAPASEAAASEELSAAAALAIQSRWRGVAVRRRLRRARDAARRRAAEEASSSGDPLSFAGVDEAVYTPPAGLDLDAEETPLSDAEATATERTLAYDFLVSARHEYPVAPLGGVPAPRRAPSSMSAPAIAAALEAAASEWGFRASGPAEEAFLRHRARLHVEARRRARREQLKDPLERVARFRAVAAATAPKNKR